MRFYSLLTTAIVSFRAVAALSTPKRADIFSLYAYGANITGLPVQYGYDSTFEDLELENSALKTNTGLAYIGTGKSDSRLTLRVTSDSSIPWVARVNTVTVGYFYISRKTSTAGVGFPSSKNNAGQNPVMTGFRILEDQVVFTGNLSVGSYFHAQRTADLNIWTLAWHPENKTIDGAIPVVLRVEPSPLIQSNR